MKEIKQKVLVTKPVEEEQTRYETDDGLVWNNKEAATAHEEFERKYPKLDASDVEHISGVFSNIALDEEYTDQFEEDLDSNQVLILYAHSGGEDHRYEAVVPDATAVEAVVKVLHRRSIGMNYTRYVHGIVYKGESVHIKYKSSADGGTVGCGKIELKKVLNAKQQIYPTRP